MCHDASGEPTAAATSQKTHMRWRRIITAMGKVSTELPSQMVRLGSTILAVGALGLLAASAAILLSNQPDPSTRVGRHLWAGALVLACLSVQEVLLALVPLRRGEPWAIVAAAIPFLIVGAPVLYLDATHVSTGARFWTLVPQIVSQLIGGAGLVLCAVGISKVKRRDASLHQPNHAA